MFYVENPGSPQTPNYCTIREKVQGDSQATISSLSSSVDTLFKFSADKAFVSMSDLFSVVWIFIRAKSLSSTLSWSQWYLL